MEGGEGSERGGETGWEGERGVRGGVRQGGRGRGEEERGEWRKM